MKNFKKLWVILVALAFFFSLTRAVVPSPGVVTDEGGDIQIQIETTGATPTLYEEVEDSDDTSDVDEDDNDDEESDEIDDDMDGEDDDENDEDEDEDEDDDDEDDDEDDDDDKKTKKVKIGKHMVETRMEIKQERKEDRETMVAKLSNGRNAEIKVMPETASEIAIAKLQSIFCGEEDGCVIELKEVGQNDEAKAAYKIEHKKEVKVFGLFRARMRISTEVNAETGEIIKEKHPRRSFFVSFMDNDE